MTQAVKLRRQILRLALCAGLLFLAIGIHASAQQTRQQERETAALDRVTKWKIINTAIFVAALGWFAAKYAPRFFNARSSDIQKAIKDATGLKIEADFRYSDIDKKMAHLGEEVEKIRAQAKIEMEREHERVRQQTSVEVDRIHRNAQNEIEALRKEAANGVQLHTAQIALGLAERRLQDRFSEGEPENLVDDFIHLIEHGKN